MAAPRSRAQKGRVHCLLDVALDVLFCFRIARQGFRDKLLSEKGHILSYDIHAFILSCVECSSHYRILYANVCLVYSTPLPLHILETFELSRSVRNSNIHNSPLRKLVSYTFF